MARPKKVMLPGIDAQESKPTKVVFVVEKHPTKDMFRWTVTCEGKTLAFHDYEAIYHCAINFEQADELLRKAFGLRT